MTGYDPTFLAREVALPAAVLGQPTVLLDYEHFSVLQNTRRRFAQLTAVNIDGALLVDLGRGDDWHLDERIAPDEQFGNELYSRNDLDRGHLVRRRDPVWGTDAEARRANVDSFAYTNAAPQASGFNQSLELWLGLETLVLDYAAQNDLKLTVFTGPVLADDDPAYRGALLPRRFWKIAVWSPDGESLAASGYLLDQSALIERLAVTGELTRDAVPPLGAFRTFQVPIADIGAAAGLDTDALAAIDVRRTASVLPDDDAATRWTELADADAVIEGIAPTGDVVSETEL